MRKSKGKRLLSLLLTLCMVISLVPVTAFAAEIGEIVQTDSADARPATVENAVWVYTGETETKLTCGTYIEHTHDAGCYRQSCDHKDGHPSTCFSEETVYELCNHSSDSEHTGSVTIAEVIEIEYETKTWPWGGTYESPAAIVFKDHPAKDVVYAEYIKNGGGTGRIASDAVVAGLMLRTDFCYTTTSELDLCTHGECSAVDGSCYTKICVLSEHTHVDGCYTTYYNWELHADVNHNGTPDEEDPSYAVTFETNGGTAIEAQTILTGLKATKPEVDPERKYYTFDGWDFDFDKAITADKTVNAKWIPNTDINTNDIADEEEIYTVVYKGFGGVELQKTEGLAYGDITPEYAGETPTRENHNFAGWTPEFAGTVTAPAKDDSTEIVYEATWTEKTKVTVIFVKDTDARDSVEIYTGNTVAEPEKPEKENHIFQGWYAKDATETFDFTTPLSESLTLYAKWAEDFNANGVDDATEAHFTVTYKDGMNGAIFADKKFENVLIDMPTPAFTPESDTYTFKGWNPVVEEKVTKGVTYTATWIKDVNKNDVEDTEETVTVKVTGNGTVKVNGTETSSFLYNAKEDKAIAIEATPGNNCYVVDVKVGEGSVIDDAKFNGTVFADILDVSNGGAYTVTVTFAERTVAVAENTTVKYNKYYKVSENNNVSVIEEQIKAMVSTVGYDANAEVRVYGAAEVLGYEVKAYNKLNKVDLLGREIDFPWGDWVFNDTTEQVKVTIPAVGKYPAVEKTFTIKVEDSRQVIDITAETSFEAASPTTANEVLEATALAAANLPKGVEVEACDYKAIESLPATVTVTFTTKGNETYQPGKAVVTVTVTQKITTADLTVAVGAGSGVVNGETEKTFAIDPGSYTLNVKPDAGYYVDYIVVDGNTITRDMMTAGADYAFSYTLENVVAGEKHTVTAYFMKPEIAVASTTATMNYNEFVADVNAQIVKTVPYTVKPEGNIPAGELKIYYQARTAGTLTTELWLEVGTDLNKVEYLGAHAFGKSATESVRYEYVLADGFKVTSDVITLTLTDERAVTEIRLNTEAVEVTYGQFTADELKAALLDGVYAGESKIEGAEVTFEKDPTKLNAGDEVEVTLKYAGTADYQDAAVTAKIKINKAPVTVTVNSAMVKYGTSYGDLVTTDPADVKTIDLIIGLDAASLQLDGEGSVTGAETVINMRLPEKIQNAFDKIGLTNGADMTLTEAATLLENGKGLMATLGVSEETVDMLVTSMNSLKEQIGEVRIAVGAPLPANIGAYLVAGITADENYQTAINVGYLAITPNGQRAYLDWKIHDENGAVALPAIQNGDYDLSAYVTEVAEGSVEEATKELEHIFFGVDKDGNILLTQDQNDLTLGAYTELAFILNWGNEMYYAEPIARAFVVVPKYISVTFVDENGDVNPDRVFTYDGKAHGMKAVVEGVAEPGANLTVTYRGVQTDGTVYESTTPPVNAGAYAVTAIYVEKDANGTITGMGFALGAMKINLSGDATITVEDFVQKTYDGTGYDIISMITSAPDDAARLIVTSSIDTTGDVSVNGLEGIGNNVNMDFPDRVDKVLSGIDFFKPAYNGEGLTVNNFVDWIKANEAVFTGMNLDAAKVSALTALLAKLPDNTVVKFDEIETVSPSSVGAYVVMGMILDPNYKPVVDTGMLVIVPDAEQVTLKYEEDFNGNNIFTPEALKYIDLDAAAYNEDETLNTEATALVQNVYAGIDAQGNEVLTTDWTTLKTGVYTEYSYLLAMGNKTYYAVPVSRTFIIAPDVITVKFVDGNDDPNYIRKFTYDGNPHAMEAVATDASGNVVTDGDMIVKYIGISGDGEGYNSTTAPTKAGVYTVTATYVEKDADGSVAAAGFAAGAMAIEKAESTFDIADTTATYDGEGHFVTVTNNENAKYVALIANRADKTVNVQIPEEFDAIVAELPESVDVKELKDVLNKAINKVFGHVGENVTMPENFQTKLDALLTEVETLMAEVPNVTVTFNEENPVNAGTYEVYVVTYAANHNSTYDKANLEITKRPVTITADDKEVIVGNAEPEYTYSVTEGCIVEGDELEVTVDCPSYEDVVGTYEIVATCEAHMNYEVTAENGTLTVTEKPVVPVTGVTLNNTTATLEIGETTTLTATVEPADASVQSVTWTSSDESVATVDANGVVTAVGEGEAIITVTTADGAYTADCTVTVKKEVIPVTGITLSSTETTLEVGKTTTLTATVNPENATNTGVTWTSDDESVVTVVDGVVTAVGEGEATITVTTVDGGFTTTCTVKVTAVVEPEKGYTISGNVTSFLDEEGTVTIQLIPEGAAEALYETTMIGNTGVYSMEGVLAGSYTMTVSKEDHVTREYEITVSDGVVDQPVKICPLGDVTGDGKVNSTDLNRMYAHVNGRRLLTGYEFECGNVVGNTDVVNSTDLNRLYAHVNGRLLLW